MTNFKLLFTVVIYLVTMSSLIAQRVLVVSGGGARGAWGGGVAQYLVQEQNNDYELVIGTSTGSLMAPLIATDSFDILREVYTGVTNRSIFSKNPFKLKKDATGRVTEVKVKQIRAICRIVLGKKTLGETKRLRKLIYSTYHQERYENIVAGGDEVIITVANLSNSGVYYFSSKQSDFDCKMSDCADKTGKELKVCRKERDAKRKAFLDWIWRSANQPLFMTLSCTDGTITDADGNVTTNENCWVDGGLRENIPLLRGIQHVMQKDSLLTNNPVIDVIINNRQEIDLNPRFKKNIVNSLLRTIGVLTFDVRDSDVSLPGRVQEMFDQELKNQNIPTSTPDNYIAVNLYFMPDEVYNIHKWDLHFDKERMTELWEAGESFRVEPIKMTISKDVARLLLQKGQEINVCSGLDQVSD